MKDLHVYGLYGCLEKQSRTLLPGRHQAELLHRTSIVLALARGISLFDRLPPLLHRNFTLMPLFKQDLNNAMGVMCRARDVEQYHQAHQRQ